MVEGREVPMGYRFLMSVFATWRIAHLLSNEDGPADLVVRLRARLGSGLAGQAMDCFQCLSFWVAAPFAVYVGKRPGDRVVAWLAVSGAACLLEQGTTRSEEIPPRVDGIGVGE